MTFSVLAALTATFLTLPSTIAQTDSRYTVWSSVIFSRTGDRTPLILGDTPTQLTTLGAQQQYANGQFFRDRYLTTTDSEDGVGGAPIQGMNAVTPDVSQIYLFGLDFQWTLASAQAFMQGFYPPFQINTNNTEEASLLDPFGFLANGTYMESPLGGYQYAPMNGVGAYDPQYPFVGGTLECQGWTENQYEYMGTEQFLATQMASLQIYQDIGNAFLGDVPQIDWEGWGYVNAYAIYDYVNYLNTHNQTAYDILSNPDEISAGTDIINYLSILRWYSDQQQYALLGDFYAVNNVTDQPWISNIKGSISTIAGNMLASKMVSLLQSNVISGGQGYKFNLMVGEHEPLMSMLALMDLPALNSNFFGLPEFGSSAVFELYSITDSSEVPTYPSEDDLWVRFYFRNGTSTDEAYTAYPLFGLTGPEFEMQWGTFLGLMNEIAIGDIGFWCQQCGPEITDTTRVFCSYWNTSNSLFYWGEDPSEEGEHYKVSPVVAGVIGAIVALVVAGILFGALMLIGGVRFHRNPSRKSDLGGFKGGQKLASDRDLTLPKGGAMVGATVETPGSPVAGGHERVGSWELKQHDLPNIAATHPARRPSFEEDEEVDISNRKPVRPDERV